MRLRVANLGDVAALHALQQQCYIANLSAEEQQDGFLYKVLDQQQLSQAIAERSVVLAERDGRVLAMAVFASWSFWGFSTTLIDVAEQLPGLDLPLNCDNSVFWGPVAVCQSSRGSGVFTELVDFAVAHLKGRYRYLYSYVHHRNHRSLAAHINKAQFELQRDLILKGEHFRELILPL
ncbi:GNAT family N-acetyltransferase [Ferrimonas senticii]|uniref:GNAT family N-acetyltransferase n=1 Tax=Ferrimonas senticii TaxID=394566 RepID=UPI0004238277|nr:GNAT family N-acetyltransferase [Ferrimonas senticii]